MKFHKGELLAILCPKVNFPKIVVDNARWASGEAKADSTRDAESEPPGPGGWSLDSIDPDELDPAQFAARWRCGKA